MLLPGLLSYVYLGPTFGVVQNMVGFRRRATATAILFFFLNLIGLGIGPPFTGWVIDQFAALPLRPPGRSDHLASLRRHRFRRLQVVQRGLSRRPCAPRVPALWRRRRARARWSSPPATG